MIKSQRYLLKKRCFHGILHIYEGQKVLGIFLDTETNGLNHRKHKILELAFKVIDVCTGTLVDQFESVVFQSPKDWKSADPSSLQVTGFTYEEICLKGRPKKEIVANILTRFKNLGIKRGQAVFICQNPSFDRAFFAQLIDPDLQEKLGWPYHWLDLASMHWSKNTELAWEKGVSKDKIALSCGLPPEDKPHRAMNGVNHLLMCYEAIIGFPRKSGTHAGTGTGTKEGRG